ncbi:BEL1-like homeodomain protein 6 [Hibiscus syriacus]|uniref:BEL1-like homeodomain protein 6 n=1 Tax=Hibiscus syriacus TaxID=106335 RepID=A0A6A3ATU5_HIBSY|nr:BEL1-like homeodomain protein 6 [Hibiscus syriacus]
MSQDYHHHHHQPAGIFSFSNGFERSAISHQDQQQQQLHLAQQIRRDKLRVEGFEQPPPPLVGIEEEESNALPVYETPGMLSSEMFYFPSGVAATAASTELLDQPLQGNYRGQKPPNEWYSNRQGGVVGGLGQLGESKSHNNRDSLAQQQLPSIHADSAAAMHLFLMNPQPRSPSPPPPSTSLQGFNVTGPGGTFPPQFTLVPDSSHEGANPIEIGGTQGLSLSLSSLQHLEAAKAEELRMGAGGLLYYNQGGGSSTPHFQYKHLQGGVEQNHQVQVGYGSSLGMVNVLRNSKYAKAAQELLEEFCSVGRGQFKKKKLGRNPSSNPGGGEGSSSSTKDLPALSAADRIEHQRRKVDRRYNHYCEQMQTLVNSFDLVMGFEAAVPYTALAQKAMSRHFRCLKDAISGQLKRSCELLGEKDGAGTSGITKGETPRLKMLEQSLRQQRAYHQMGMMEHEAWRPQRGLPERSVNILRAWLFEHFLHPYPSDADKHLLARQTGLSRNQVSNWFINARVRLWKPMVEDMYKQESKEEEGDNKERNVKDSKNIAQTSTLSTAPVGAAGGTLTPLPPPPPTASTTTAAAGKRSEINAIENDPSFIAISKQCFLENQATNTIISSIPPTTTTTTTITTTTNTSTANTTATEVAPPISQLFTSTTHHDSDIHQRLLAGVDDTFHRGSSIVAAADYGTITGNTDIGSTLLRFGTTAGDVSLTLGLRHAENMPDKASSFSVTDFGGC